MNNQNLTPNPKSTDKVYYYNETRTKILSYLGLILFMPLNIYLYNKGAYGERDINLSFFGKEFLTKGILYDIPFIILIFYGLIKFIKEAKDKSKTKVIITPKYRIIGIILYAVISIILMIIYFKFNPYTSIALFLGTIGLVFILLDITIRELTKKEYIQSDSQE